MIIKEGRAVVKTVVALNLLDVFGTLGQPAELGVSVHLGDWLSTKWWVLLHKDQ